MSVVTASSFVAANLKVDSNKKQLDKGGAIVYLNYNGGKLRVQTPSLRIPFNASDYQDNGKFKVNLDLKNHATDPKVKAYYNMLNEIDKVVIQNAVKNCKNWLDNDSLTKETITAAKLFTKSIRVGKDKKTNTDRDPLQSVAIKKKYGTIVFETTLYDSNNQKIEGKGPLEVLRRGAQVTCILDATSIWVAGGKFGVSWKLVQARVDVEAESNDGEAAFLDEEDGEDAPTENIMVADDAVETEAPQQEEDEEEDDGEEEEVVQPPPVKVAPAKKTTVTKKK